MKVETKYAKNKIKESAMKIVFFIAATIFVFAVVAVCLFIFAQAVPAISKIGFFEFIFNADWSPTNSNASYGIATMIVGSCYITAGALILGVPIGFLTAVFMARYCPQPIYKFIKPLVNILAGIPSIVYGFFGVSVIVPFVMNNFGGSGSSILTASIVLGIMILPTIISVSENAIKSLPKNYLEGALALGSTKERTIFLIEVPAAKSGILTSVILGLGRVIGETMAVVMIAGNQTIFPTSVLDGVRTLTANIVLELGYATDLHRGALIATAAVLFVFILLITLLVSVIRKGSATKND